MIMSDSTEEGDMDIMKYPVESITPLPSTSLLNSGLTTKEKLKIYCKPSYHMRKLKNKGAIMVLVWGYLITSIFFHFKFVSSTEILFYLQLVGFGTSISVIGWLADVYFGRYKIIRCSMWIMWSAFMLSTISSVVAQFVESYSHMKDYINGVLMVITMIGLGAFEANIIQFGLDQLQ